LVLIFCQQHGDEPSGKEAALVLARDLRDKYKYLLESLDLILIPQLNPDGSEKGERRNANDMDLNRNHAILSEPESIALHKLFFQWMPEVALDVHEYNEITELWVSKGFVKDEEEKMGFPQWHKR
jgi:predicted deacylase